MSRRRKNPVTDVTRKQNISVSVPRYMADELAKHDNASAIITKLLEENWSRVSTMTVEGQIEAERQRVIDILKSSLEEVAIEVFSRVRANRIEGPNGTRN